jgi:C-terminal processing protease CtpA/Prc
VSSSLAGEDIYGMTFDGLYGLASILLENNEYFRQNARGLILDHRAGDGGTVDSPQAITQLVRTPFDLSVGPRFMAIAGDDGPATQADGLLLFDRFKAYPTELYRVGSDNPETRLPVALLIHRDGSASDWLPHGLKGAPNVRIFGPHETAGAFSSFYQFMYWSRFEFVLASGDTVSFEGEPLVGSGILPDEVVEHTQSALLEGRDLPFEAAIAWVRENLK